MEDVDARGSVAALQSDNGVDRQVPTGTKGAADTRAKSRSFIVIAILFALQITDGIDQAALAFTAPYVRATLAIGMEPLGAAFSAGYIGTALGAVLFGTLADYIDRKVALCLASLCFSLGSLCTIFVQTGPELIIVRLFTGLALGGLFPVVASVIFDAVPKRFRATAITLVSVGAAAGVALCGPLVAFIEPRFGWRSLFIVGAVVPAFLTALAIIFISTPRRLKDPEVGDAVANRLLHNLLYSVASLFRGERWKTTLVLWLAFVVSAVPMFFSLSWLPTLAHAAHISPTVAAIGPSIFSVSGLVFAIVVARVIDKVGFLPAAVTTALAAPAFVFLGQSFGNENMFLLACGFAGALSVSSVNLFVVVAGMVYDDALRARGFGWALAVMRLGASFAPWLGGFLLAREFPVGMIFLGLALSMLVSGLAIFALWKMANRQAVAR